MFLLFANAVKLEFFVLTFFNVSSSVARSVRILGMDTPENFRGHPQHQVLLQLFAMVWRPKGLRTDMQTFF